MKNNSFKKFVTHMMVGGFSFGLGATTLVTKLLAEETTGEKIQNSADETGTELKKDGRAVKKKVRDTTGNGSVKEDVKDSAKNVRDETTTKAKKIKRKVD